jgi:hypothetical protein
MPDKRRHHRSPSLLALLVALALLAGSQPARACTCGYPSAEKFVEQSEVIFSGIVVLGGFRLVPYSPVRYTILVTRVWKGRVGPLVDVVSDDWRSFCGVQGLHFGAELPMFASRGPTYYGAYRISTCSVGPRRDSRRFERYWRAVREYARAREARSGGR